MRTYKFKLYEHKRNRYLKRQINAAGWIWNHCVALQRRYYRMFGKYLGKVRLQSHIAKLRNRNSFWLTLGSQAVQQIVERVDKAYQDFFKKVRKGIRPPKFKKVRKYPSSTLKQAGYKFLGGSRLKIGKVIYQFWNHREVEGKVKTVTVKRTPLGELFLCVVAEGPSQHTESVKTGKAAGFDFGLKTFLTTSDGEKIASPQFLKASFKELAKANQSLARKKKGSHNWEIARKHLCRVYEKISNQRRYWFWKLAHYLTDRYDELYFEDLNLDGMKRLWGRKISDLAFYEFLQILKWVAKKKSKVVGFVGKWFPSSKTCSNCGHIHKKLELSDRRWRCSNCQSENDRDENAANNILVEGQRLAA